MCLLSFLHSRFSRDKEEKIPHLLTPSPHIARLYFNLDILTQPPFKAMALSLHVGGSNVYRVDNLPARDFDAIMLLPTLQDILRVFRCTNALASLLMVIPELGTEKLAIIAEQCLVECHTTLHPFEGIRFSGTTAFGEKKSIKLLSYDYLHTIVVSDIPCPLPILSLKDRRQYSLPNGRWRIQPVSTDSSGSVYILHDADIFLPHYSANRSDTRALPNVPAFGCTADLFLTSRLVYQQIEPYHVLFLRRLLPGTYNNVLQDLTLVQRAMFQKLVRMLGSRFPTDLLSVFARSASFSAGYRRDLIEKLGIKSSTRVELISAASNIDFIERTSLLWPPEDEISIGQERASTLLTLSHCRPEISGDVSASHYGVSLPYINSDILDTKLCAAKSTCTPFSQNSNWGTCLVDESILFWKRSLFFQAEVLGGSLLSKFIASRCQQPVGIDLNMTPPIIFYSFIDGETMAQIRLRELHLRMRSEGPLTSDHHDIVSTLLGAAVTRSDDMLYCWTQSILNGSLQHHTNTGYTGVHRFFADRLLNDKRMLEFYGNGLSWSNYDLTFAELVTAKIRINGIHFPSLTVLFRQAEAALQYVCQCPRIQVVGHGDLHGGNIIVRDDIPTGTLLYVDYEAVGHHSPWLDIAKPLYNDCFFVYMYADLLELDLFDSGIVHSQFYDGILDIQFGHPSTGHPPLDPLARALFEILIEGLLKPFERSMKELENKRCFNGDCFVLPHALLACALLTRNFNLRPDMFFANLAIAVILSQTPHTQLVQKIYDLL